VSNQIEDLQSAVDAYAKADAAFRVKHLKGLEPAEKATQAAVRLDNYIKAKMELLELASTEAKEDIAND